MTTWPAAALQLRHLAGRLVESCRPGAPSAADLAWVESSLSGAEFALWSRMSNPDKRHSVAVGRSVISTLAGRDTHETSDDAWARSAALLHDVGKVVCGYRTPARTVATVVWAVVPSERAERWRASGWPWRRLGEYHLHPTLGAELCAAAGAHPHVAAWAAEHHLRPAEWTVPIEVGAVLKECDDD